MKATYNYGLTDTQRMAANHFAEACEALSRAGVSVLWERDTNTLLCINSQGIEITGEFGFDDSYELKGSDIDTDNVVCVSADIISDLYSSVHISPKTIL